MKNGRPTGTPNRRSQNVEIAKRLWAVSEPLTGVRYPEKMELAP